jgi:AAA+ superfamily predicted ATPase
MANTKQKLKEGVEDRRRRSVPLHIAHELLEEALRRQHYLLGGAQAAVGVLIPEGAEQIFREAADDFLSLLGKGSDDVLDFDVTHDVFFLEGKRWRKKGRSGSASIYDEDDLIGMLGARTSTLVLASDVESFTPRVRAALDDVVEIGLLEGDRLRRAVRAVVGTAPGRLQLETLLDLGFARLGSVFRKGRPVSDAVRRARILLDAERKPGVVKQDPTAPSLDDLHGLGEAGDWGRDLAADLADYRAGRIGWSEIDRGILLYGPPGTGKTTFARALGRTCGVRVVAASATKWWSSGGGYLSDALKAMRKSFADAKEAAEDGDVGILFVDELDSLGNRDLLGHDKNSQLFREYINAFLECLDGFEGREGVVVVGATNNPDHVDPAIRRSGRLDRMVAIPLPDAAARQGILRWHLAGDLRDADLSDIAARTGGLSGADLERIAREGRRRARRERRPMILEDLERSLPKPIVVPPEDLRRAAVHEAGHALVGHALGHRLHEISISPVVYLNASVFEGGGCQIEKQKDLTDTRDSYITDDAIFLAGLAAEEVMLGARGDGGGWGESGDLYKATLTCARMEITLGLGRCLAVLAPSSGKDDVMKTFRGHPVVQAAVEQTLREQFDRAKDIVTRRRADVERLAAALLERHRIPGEEAIAILDAQPRLELITGGVA